jgi:hypothetical protein
MNINYVNNEYLKEHFEDDEDGAGKDLQSQVIKDQNN